MDLLRPYELSSSLRFLPYNSTIRLDMKTLPFTLFLRAAALMLILAALALAFFQYRRLQQANSAASIYPSGEEIAGVPVGGLTREQASAKVQAAYALPVELLYEDAAIQVSPGELGFRLDLEKMLAEAGGQAARRSGWSAFWDALWDQTKPAVATKVALTAILDDAAIRDYLRQQISPRYDQPAGGTFPNSDTITFRPTSPGARLDVDAAVPLIHGALTSLSARSVQLPIQNIPPPRPPLSALEGLLRQIFQYENYSGLAELYIQDLRSGEEINFAVQNGQPVKPGIAFTAASTIKIPVMVSVFRRTAEPTPPDVETLVEHMITESDNPSTDQVAQEVLDPVSAPLKVTQDMQALGFKNIFWAGFFAPGSALLNLYQTPANQRSDINTAPDIYAQTTAEDMGRLLAGIYACAQKGSGPLISTFPGEISQAECQHMLDLMSGNHTPQLLEPGLPDGTRFDHKHGWVVETSDGLIHNIADAGLVFSPGGDYVVDIYLYNTNQLVFDPINTMVAYLSRAIYNFMQIK